MDRRTFLHLSSLGALGMVLVRPDSEVRAGSGSNDRATRRHWAWTRAVADASDATEAARYGEFRRAGVGSLLLGRVDPRSARLAAAQGLEVHAWMWTLCRSDRELTEDHPDWFAVSREGKSTLEQPPYVAYYKFLCPNREGVRRYLREQVAELARRPELAGVHLDYVRFPDVILPRALWEKYDLVQHEELPPFDFCYCEVCRDLFRAESGHDPLELADPAADPRWRRFRWNSVTALVNELAAVVHDRDKQITAAVFPTPTIARRLVRQDWPAWDLDAVLPMLYHNFYEEPVAWIEEAVREGVAALPAGRPLYAGLYLPALKTDEDYTAAVAAALKGGAAGVSLFGGLRALL